MNENLVSEFIKIGCKNTKDAAIAAQVYLELCEVKKYWDVKYFYTSKIQKIYFTAKKSKSKAPTLFVPRAVSEALSFLNLKQFFKICDNSENQSICIVIVQSDSTCVYYQITNGLGPPAAATTSKLSKDDKSRKIDKDLKRNREIIEQAALYGIAVTLPKKQKLEELGNVRT